MGRTLPVQFLRSTVDAGAKRGLDIERALRAAGANWSLYGNDRARVLPEQATRAVRELWAQTDDELLGLGPQPMPRGMLRMIGLTVIHTPDLGAGLHRLAEFLTLTPGLATALTRTEAGTACFAVDASPATRLDPIVSFALLAGTHQFGSWLIDRRIPLSSVEFPFTAAHLASDYELIFGVSPAFGAGRSAISFDARLLTQPIVRTETDLKPLLRDAPGSLLYRRTTGSTTAGRVRKILEHNTTGLLSAEEVADRLAVSTPYLRKLLRKEGTSFRTTQEEVLRDRAVEALVTSDETIADLSARLGYSEPRAFRRAFRKWTGSAPGDYRAETTG